MDVLASTTDYKSGSISHSDIPPQNLLKGHVSSVLFFLMFLR